MKGYKHLTAEQRRQVLDSYAQLRSVTAVAENLGISTNQVRHVLQRTGEKPSGAKGGACYQNIELLREMALAGASLSEIARRIGTKHQTVALFLERHAIPRTPFHQAGENHPAWRGGRTRDKDGYVLIHRPDHPQADRHGYVREHRLVMETVLGRPLLRTEVVDHRDGQRNNNDPSNLQVFASNREHLAATLAGRVPQWTAEERARQRAPRPHSRRKQPHATPSD